MSERSCIRAVVVSESAFTVQDHGVHTAFAEQARALTRLGARVRLNDLRACRRADLVVAHSPGPFAAACLSIAGERGVAYAHVTPETLVDSLRGEPGWGGLVGRYLRRFYSAARLVLAPSTTARCELISLGVDPDRIAVLPPGIDGDRITTPAAADLAFLLRSASPSVESRLVLGVGQIQPRKGIDRFVEAARALPQHRFVWVGGRPFGPLTSGSRRWRRAIDNAPANTTFVGRVSPLALAAWYQAADLFFLPSRQENFGQVVVEAAAARLPLVLSSLPSFAHHFGAGALLAEHRDLAAAVARAAGDREELETRGRSSATLAERYSARAAAKRLLTLCAHRS